MSFYVNNPTMMHAAVNTDPLQPAQVSTPRQLYYGLKERKITHVKVTDTAELHLWYDFGAKIGEGSFGVVQAVVEKSNSKNWAMKTVVKNTTDSNRLKMVEREIQILKLIDHPHIIHLEKVFESPRKIYLIIELCYGELFKLYKECKPFSEKVAKILMRQLAEAVGYLHKYDIVHRDIKMENILMGENPSNPKDEYYIKLTDFGLSIVKCGMGIENMLRDFCGTLHYMAPEVIIQNSYSQQCDMWAIGVILYMLVNGKYPFYAGNERDVEEQICSANPDVKNDNLSPEVTDLILLLLKKDPAHRISATEMLQHPWMLNRKMSKALQYNILQMMKDWKNDLRVPVKESRQMSSTALNVENSTVPKKKQPMNLPKTNIHFERVRKSSVVSTKLTTNMAKDKRASVKESDLAARGPLVRDGK